MKNKFLKKYEKQVEESAEYYAEILADNNDSKFDSKYFIDLLFEAIEDYIASIHDDFEGFSDEQKQKIIKSKFFMDDIKSIGQDVSESVSDTLHINKAGYGAYYGVKRGVDYPGSL